MGMSAEVGKDLCPRSGNDLCSLETGEDNVCVRESAGVCLSRNSSSGNHGRRGLEADELQSRQGEMDLT